MASLRPAQHRWAGDFPSRIARQLRVSTAATYRHFPGRDGVVAAITTVAAIAAEMDQAAGPDPVEQLAATAGAYVRYWCAAVPG